MLVKMPHRVDPDRLYADQGGNRGIVNNVDIPLSLREPVLNSSPRILQYPLGSAPKPLIEMDDIFEPRGEYVGGSVIEAKNISPRHTVQHKNRPRGLTAFAINEILQTPHGTQAPSKPEEGDPILYW